MPDPHDPDATLPPPEPDPDLTRPPGSPPVPPTLTAAGAGSPDDPPGRPNVPGFEIIRELGRGGMGVVYLARQVKLNRLVALKMVLAGGHAGPKERLRFLQEAEAVAAVQHPGIVQVFEFGTCSDQPYFALEYCPGGSLAGKLSGTPLPPRPAAELIGQVARAVQAAHDRGIVHRDLKPDNVLFAADGTPKVTDFGLARKTESDSGLTATGAIMGTPSYMAPEQAAAAKGVGPPADVWALGAILYECLTGRPPFKAATVIDTILQVTNADPVPPRQLQPNLPRDLDTICLKCLQKDPKRRYASAADVADDLRRYQAGDPIAARPVSSRERLWRVVKKHPVTSVLALAAMLAPLAISFFIATTLYVFWVKNAELARERNTARVERDAAVAARADAEAQRKKAHTRLEKGVEAVEKLLNRLGGRTWASTPELIAERRKMLEDVVAFYEGFGDEDAADPLVRRETARALLRTGRVYAQLAEYAKAQEVLARARTILEGLLAEAPDDGRYLADLAETIQHTGHGVLISGGMTEESSALYREAAGVARRAAAARPGDDDVRRTLVSCLVSLGLVDPAADPFKEALGHADAMIAQPGAPYPNWVLAAHAYAGAGTVAFRTGRQAAGVANIGRAREILAATAPDPDAPAQYREMFDMTTGLVKLYDASLIKDRDPAKAVGLLRETAAVFDRLLAVYPKVFPYRVYKLTGLALETSALAALGRTEELLKRQAELTDLEKAILKDTPKATFVTMIACVPRSEALVAQARAGGVGRLDAAADELLSAAQALKLPFAGAEVRYNVACAFALASRSGDPAERERRAARAVRELDTLAGAGYFKHPARTKHFRGDTDLDPLRDRDDYKKFVAKLPAGKP
jgi:tetratricopeptide (TPR) repeat protein